MTTTSPATITDIAVLESRITSLEQHVQEIQDSLPKDQVTIVVFSGDLDKVLAAFIIATGALAMGLEVSMFFTFWGLNALRKQRILGGKKITEKMMSLMSPSSTKNMSVSKLNFFGAGSKMLRVMMKENNVETFESFIDLAEEMGATLYSCAMSRDVMGIEQSELRDSSIEAGAATFIADGLESKFTLFI